MLLAIQITHSNTETVFRKYSQFPDGFNSDVVLRKSRHACNILSIIMEMWLQYRSGFLTSGHYERKIPSP